MVLDDAPLMPYTSTSDPSLAAFTKFVCYADPFTNPLSHSAHINCYLSVTGMPNVGTKVHLKKKIA
jgi:hypothetical protein